MNKNAKWITVSEKCEGAVCFSGKTKLNGKVRRAELYVSSVGNYVARINGIRVGDAVLTPGWTSFKHRIQYQRYDVSSLLSEDVSLDISVGGGWALGSFGEVRGCGSFGERPALISALEISYEDGSRASFVSDVDWEIKTTDVLYTDIYHGETVDLTCEPKSLGRAVLSEFRARLIPQVGEWIREIDRLAPIELINAPNGDRIIDFGQNMTGYVELKIKAHRGSRIVIQHAEVLDSDGNFYNANFRGARSEDVYVASGGDDVFKPQFTFHGFRYIRLAEYPLDVIDLDSFRAVVVHSDMERTGYFKSGNEKINQLYHNIIWGQKSNYLDVPTDCPQRDERLGWTGDTQVFCRTAAINYNVKRFFEKWLGDLACDQEKNGGVPSVIPSCFKRSRYSAAWGDAACIVPWEIYRAYGDKKLLKKNYPAMKKWVEFMHGFGPEEYLWLGGYHYGDWLAMDNGEDSYVGATSVDLIASAYFAYSTDILVKAGRVLGYDVSEYERLYERIVSAFRERYLPNGELRQLPDLDERGRKEPPRETQTAYTLILYFRLCEERDRQKFADRLAGMIRENGGLMTTGFVGTPYLLHALTEGGHTDVAYDLLFEERNPSWLYSVCHGATTMWEHWNSLKEDGSFWSTNMNSFNHYAYGAVYDWIFGKALGINVSEDAPAYREITFAPHPDRRLGFADASVKVEGGLVRSSWYYKGDRVHYEIEVPRGSVAKICLPSGRCESVGAGIYHFAE